MKSNKDKEINEWIEYRISDIKSAIKRKKEVLSDFIKRTRKIHRQNERDIIKFKLNINKLEKELRSLINKIK